MTTHDPVTLDDLKGSAARRRRERIIRSAFFMAAGLAILISVAIVLSLLGDTITFLRGIELGDLFADAWQPRAGDYGLATIISGTLVIAIIAMAVATPLGLGAAIYLAEYASPRVRSLAQADPRDPGHHPQRRAGLLRAHGPESRGRPAAVR